MDKLTEKLVKTSEIFEGKVIKVRCDSVILPNGKNAKREIVLHPGAVAVVPILDDGRIVMVRQYRYPINQLLLEIPAGKLDPGEAPDVCAQRELMEETGYTPGKLTKLAAIHTTPGFSNEIIHLYMAEKLEFGEQKTDEDEFINIEYYTKEQVCQLIKDGLITDAKTLVALFMAGVK